MAEQPSKVAVIDGNSLMHRAFHAVPDYMTAPDGTPTNACFGFMQMLIKMVEQLEPDGIICAFDGGIPDFRMEAIKEYKAQRPPTDPKLKAQFPVIEKLLNSLAIPVIRLDGWEGDDILGTVSAQGTQKGIDTMLVSGDRDVLQLVTGNTSVVTTKKGLTDIIIYTPDAVEERYGIRPDQVPDYLGLKGDTSDNYPGIPGIGEKTAAKLLQEYGTLEEVLAHASEQKGKLGERLQDPENQNLAHLSRRAATISKDVPVEVDFQAAFFPQFDPAVVREAFSELELFSPLGKILSFAGGEEQVPLRQELELVLEPVQRGDEARAFIQDFLAAQDPSAIGEPVAAFFCQREAESLFDPEVQELHVATAKGVAVVEGEAAFACLAQLFKEAPLLVCADSKTLFQQVYPKDSGEEALVDIQDFDPERVFDLSLAAYLLDSSRSEYDVAHLCAHYLHSDLPEAGEGLSQESVLAAATLALYEELKAGLERDLTMACFALIEMPLVPVLAEMERLGVAIDADMLQTSSQAMAQDLDQIRAQVFEVVGEEFNLDSPKQLGTILFEKMGLPIQKKNQRGYSTDASVLESLAEKTDSPLPALILEYRELSKMKSTYLDALPKLQASGDGRIHTSFNQTVAATGRLSSSNPNLQNIPVRTELGRRIRQAFVPIPNASLMEGNTEEPMVFLSADYSQIELRLLAHLSGDLELIKAFTSGEDFHAATASRVFGVAPDQVTTEMRSRAKAVNFGIVYGQQAFGLGKSLHIPLKEAQAMIDRYYEAYPQVRVFLDTTVEQAKEDGYASTIFGRKRHIRELGSSNYMTRQFGERTAMNHPMQGSAADIIKLAMIEVAERLREEGFRAQMVLQVHDELDFVCPVSEVDALSEMVRSAMSQVVDLTVPLEVSVVYGENWAEAK